MKQALAPADQGSNTDFAEGEGSRCRSNADGAESFAKALAATRKLPAAERDLLIEARRNLQPDCSGASNGMSVAAEAASRVQSRDGKSFATYLQGAAAFYDGDFEGASAHFATLRKAKHQWLREAAHYMLARVEVNRAQIGVFDEYGTWIGPESADQQVIDRAEQALNSYVRAYPRGLYTRSARGLLRRVYWLGGRTDKLVAQYVEALSDRPGGGLAGHALLAEEIDSKLLTAPSAVQAIDPLLRAVALLKNMRDCPPSSEDPGCEGKALAADLASEEAYFKQDPDLLRFLMASHAFYVRNEPGEVLRLIPPEEPAGTGFTYLRFSRQMLRQMALEALGRATTDQWLSVLPGASRMWQRPAFELALALHFERTNAVAKIFDRGSPIGTPLLRETLLVHAAGPDLLRARARSADGAAHERELALYILLYKEISRGLYSDFLADLALLPTDAPATANPYELINSPERPPLGIFTAEPNSQAFACPSLGQTARRLADNPVDARGRLCVAEFVRTNWLDDNFIDFRPPADELGGAPSDFPGSPYSRLEVYKSIIADPKAPAADKAYALYRAVRCYAPARHNGCGGEDVPVAQRKAWFQRLKRDFPSSQWAKELQYYW
jgi:TolA-binding protein